VSTQPHPPEWNLSLAVHPGFAEIANALQHANMIAALNAKFGCSRNNHDVKSMF